MEIVSELVCQQAVSVDSVFAVKWRSNEGGIKNLEDHTNALNEQARLQ